LSELFATGRIVDLILGLVVLEALAVTVYCARTGRGVAPGDLFPNLLAGAFPLLVLRFALAGAPWHWIALCLPAALVSHIMDLRRRWRR
jgi:hypothetical protein